MDIRKIAQNILSNEDLFLQFTRYLNLTNLAAEALLKKLIANPEPSPEIEEFIFSLNSSADFKSFYMGEKKGHVQGYELGYARGIALGALTVLGIGATVALAYFNINVDTNK